MANFPTLSESYPSYPVVENREDSVLRSSFEGGYVQTRPRFTRVRKKWQINYKLLSSADRTLIANFFDTTVNGGADAFTWTCPLDLTAYSVRFTAPPIFSYSSYGRWDINFELEQV
jgi:phage-related protein